MSDEMKPKPGPDPERLVIEEDPEEALGRLLRKSIPAPGEWRPGSVAWSAHRTVEYEDDTGERHIVPPNPEGHHIDAAPSDDLPQVVRWRYLD